MRNRLRLPDEVLTLIDTFWEGSLGAYSNLEINAMAELESAIQQQRRVLESINETEQITVASSSTGSYGPKEVFVIREVHCICGLCFTSSFSLKETIEIQEAHIEECPEGYTRGCPSTEETVGQRLLGSI